MNDISGRQIRGNSVVCHVKERYHTPNGFSLVTGLCIGRLIGRSIGKQVFLALIFFEVRPFEAGIR